MLHHVERPEGNDNTRHGSEGCYNYLRASTHAVEPEMSGATAIIVSAHVELCPIKYSNLWVMWQGFLVMCYSYL